MLKAPQWKSSCTNYVVDMRKLITLCLLLLSTFSFGQIDYLRKVTQTLTSEELHGRGYVMGGDSLAALYIAKEMKDLGIQPYKRSYFQPFSFAVNTFPNRVQLQTEGTNYVLGQDFIVECESGSFDGNLNVYRISYDFFRKQDLLLAELKREINARQYNTLLFDFRIDTLAKERKEMVQQLMPILTPYFCVIAMDDSKWNWSVGREQLKNPIVLVKSTVSITNKTHLTVDATFKSIHKTQNVIGYIPANKKTKKTIVYTAHYDHLGRLGKEVYFPGANDNASGTAALLAVGKYFAENQPDFNVLLIAFAGEEAGLIGSEYYVNHPFFPLKDIHFLINLDIFGSGEAGITVVNGSVFTSAFDQLVSINTEKNYLPKIKARGKAANSDHYFFTEKGVPAFFIYTEGDNKHYHDVEDTYENLSFAKTEDLIRLIIDFSKQITK